MKDVARTVSGCGPSDPIKETAMHVALVSATIDSTTADSARDHLMNEVIPMVKAAPGFIAGYWLEPVDGKGSSMIFFETEAQARAVAPPAGSVPAPGVTIQSVEFREVAANT
jgi:hypothetical protein